MTAVVALSVVQKETPAEAIGPETYLHVLEILLAEGQMWQRTKPVYAFMLANFTFNEKIKAYGQLTGNTKLHSSYVAPDYVVMCPEEYRSEYVRSLVVKDIMHKYAERIISQADINSPKEEFGGPNIWTSKQKAFEKAYTSDQPLSTDPTVADYEKNRVRLYQPNPEAAKLCLLFNEKAIVPMPWLQDAHPGVWPMEVNGALAITEANLPALIDAVADVKKAGGTREAIFQHLYKDEQEQMIPKFDIYGMEAGFLDNTHRIIAPKAETVEKLAPHRREAYREPPVAGEAAKPFVAPPVVTI